MWQRSPGLPLRAAAALALAAALAGVWVRSYVAAFSGRMDLCCVSDWLIGYASGFVRRGLAGAVILAVSHGLGISPRVIVFLILGGAYFAIFLPLAVVVLRARDLTLLDLLLVLSPFAALFPLLHQLAGERKEVLLLAAAGFAYLTALGRLDSVSKSALWAVLLAVVVAAHDALFFFLPIFVLYLQVLTPAADRVRSGGLILVMLPAAAIFALGYARSGHVDLGAICSAMARSAQGVWCLARSPGEFVFAASWLEASARDGVRSVAARYSLLTGARTVLIGILGLIPVALALTTDSEVLRRVLRGLPHWPWLFAAGLGGIVALFVVANDWNRWFYIVTSLLTMMHFAARREHA